ncbi:hypothetical protein AVEN_169072-1 [Araneus ventricosus]|uniref:Uncharacterized protein n=1 Tax=Araneus ventricosus TaxID=182803 RepID=A0A4Y2U6X7_ARAVE|nr:hypothetical protein AVEN_168915-1 [Araneus ventricosus]GBO08548.1 hypothetical protein AVEN_169072-1 [Araneus ventricosus]
MTSPAEQAKNIIRPTRQNPFHPVQCVQLRRVPLVYKHLKLPVAGKSITIMRCPIDHWWCLISHFDTSMPSLFPLYVTFRRMKHFLKGRRFSSSEEVQQRRHGRM